jgi:hypothetical protein
MFYSLHQGSQKMSSVSAKSYASGPYHFQHLPILSAAAYKHLFLNKKEECQCPKIFCNINKCLTKFRKYYTIYGKYAYLWLKIFVNLQNLSEIILMWCILWDKQKANLFFKYSANWNYQDCQIHNFSSSSN